MSYELQQRNLLKDGKEEPKTQIKRMTQYLKNYKKSLRTILKIL